jgi:hypothetical protein
MWLGAILKAEVFMKIKCSRDADVLVIQLPWLRPLLMNTLIRAAGFGGAKKIGTA